MKKITLLFVGICAMASLAYATTDMVSQNKSYSWRYKMTVEVDTPEGVKSGSSIWEVEVSPVNIGNIKGYQDHHKGEAVVVDLGERGQLFALRRGVNGRSYLTQIVYWMFPAHGSLITDEEKLEYYSNLKNESKILPPEYFPLFVHLKNINDPKTVEAVYDVHNGSHGETKTVKTNRIEEIYGQDVRIKAVKIEITDDPVAFKLHKTLTWLLDPELKRLRERPAISTSESLQAIDFQQGRIQE